MLHLDLKVVGILVLANGKILQIPLTGDIMSNAMPSTPAPASAPASTPRRSRELSEIIEAWLKHLAARGRKARTVKAFRQVFWAAAIDCGWKTLADINYENITGWLASKRGAGWKGVTYNRNLSVFRSLTRHMRRTKKIQEDPLEFADRADDDGGEGNRAATIEEARKHISYAWLRQQTDRRCKGNRALVWLMLYSHACRNGEPEKLLRRHVFIDEPSPYILWEKNINKNKKRQEVPLTRELAVLLKLHFLEQDRERKIRGAEPLGPDAPVFDVIPPRTTFRADRDAAGIVALDKRGRRYAPHSARKFFSTHMTSLGVPEKMVDRLMRHAGKVESRYYDPTVAEMAQAVENMPPLWPETLAELTTRLRAAIQCAAAPMTPETSIPTPADFGGSKASPAHATSERHSGECASGAAFDPLPGGGLGTQEADGDVSIDFDQEMPSIGRVIARGRIPTPTDNQTLPDALGHLLGAPGVVCWSADGREALADLLGALSRLVRSNGLKDSSRGDPAMPEPSASIPLRAQRARVVHLGSGRRYAVVPSDSGEWTSPAFGKTALHEIRSNRGGITLGDRINPNDLSRDVVEALSRQAITR